MPACLSGPHTDEGCSVEMRVQPKRSSDRQKGILALTRTSHRRSLLESISNYVCCPMETKTGPDGQQVLRPSQTRYADNRKRKGWGGGARRHLVAKEIREPLRANKIQICSSLGNPTGGQHCELLRRRLGAHSLWLVAGRPSAEQFATNRNQPIPCCRIRAIWPTSPRKSGLMSRWRDACCPTPNIF